MLQVSTSLSDSPAVLAQAEYGMSPQMQKYMKARAVAMGDEADFGGAVGQAGVLQVYQRMLTSADVCCI